MSDSREKSRRWREANPEAARVKSRNDTRRRRAADPERAREEYRRWREANHALALECQRPWREANRDRARKAAHDWYETNREFRLAKDKALNDATLEQAVAKRKTRWTPDEDALLLSLLAESSYLTTTELALLLGRTRRSVMHRRQTLRVSTA